MFAVSKNNPHRGGILTCAHMLPPSSQRKSSQKRDFELGLHASHHLKNNPPKGRIPKRWDKNLVQEILPEGKIINRILLIEGYLHISTFYSVLRRHPQSLCNVLGQCFWMARLTGPEPPLPISVKGSRWHGHIPPTPGGAGSHKQPPVPWEATRGLT